ncbi:MAG TPA: hypothetical protein VLV31_00365 [Candidatus Acidoferrales bacterium]|nr:hypothetical protein [Candidatus Acidoferrales bacterium]
MNGPPLWPVKDFNREMATALGSVLTVLLGSAVIDTIHSHVKECHSIAIEEIPYRPNTVMSVMEDLFSITGTITIGNAVAKRLFQNYGLDFVDKFGYDLPDYDIE